MLVIMQVPCSCPGFCWTVEVLLSGLLNEWRKQQEDKIGQYCFKNGIPRLKGYILEDIARYVLFLVNFEIVNWCSGTLVLK